MSLGEALAVGRLVELDRRVDHVLVHVLHVDADGEVEELGGLGPLAELVREALRDVGELGEVVADLDVLGPREVGDAVELEELADLRLLRDLGVRALVRLLRAQGAPGEEGGGDEHDGRGDGPRTQVHGRPPGCRSYRPRSRSATGEPALSAEARDRLVREQANEIRVAHDRPRSKKAEPQVARPSAGVDVEVVEHLDVVAEKADRSDDDVLLARRGHLVDHVDDHGPDPRNPRLERRALECGPVLGVAEALGHEARRLLELRDVGRALGDRSRDRVRREHERRGGEALLGPAHRLLADPPRAGGDEPRVVPERRQPARDLGRALAQGRARLVDGADVPCPS